MKPLRPGIPSATAALICVLAASSTACHSTWDIPYQQATRLHGYEAPARIVLLDASKSEVEFGEDTEIVAVLPDGHTRRFRLQSARVESGVLYGVTASGSPFALRLDPAAPLTIRKSNMLKPVVATVLVALSVATVLLLPPLIRD